MDCPMLIDGDSFCASFLPDAVQGSAICYYGEKTERGFGKVFSF
jgi:hypothetical protein